MKLQILTKNLLPNEVEWRIHSVTKDKSKSIVVPYIQRLCVFNRFDEEFGHDKWSLDVERVLPIVTGYQNGNIIHSHAGAKCTISVLIGGEWVSKSDFGSDSASDALKGAASDSMKRASTLWGLGRCLYNYPKISIKGDHKYIPYSVRDRLDNMVL